MYSESTPSRCELEYLTTPSSLPSTGPLPASDDRMRVNAARDRRVGHCLQNWIVRRHPEQATRSEIARVDFEVAATPCEIGGGLDEAYRQR
jgi:hypothetical protein